MRIYHYDDTAYMAVSCEVIALYSGHFFFDVIYL